MRLVRRLHSFAIGHVYIFPIEALAKVNLKRDGASREKLVMWNRWGRNNRGIFRWVSVLWLQVCPDNNTDRVVQQQRV